MAFLDITLSLSLPLYQPVNRGGFSHFIYPESPALSVHQRPTSSCFGLTELGFCSGPKQTWIKRLLESNHDSAEKPTIRPFNTSVVRYHDDSVERKQLHFVSGRKLEANPTTKKNMISLAICLWNGSMLVEGEVTSE